LEAISFFILPSTNANVNLFGWLFWFLYEFIALRRGRISRIEGMRREGRGRSLFIDSPMECAKMIFIAWRNVKDSAEIR
jgi:hypothetical protein